MSVRQRMTMRATVQRNEATINPATNLPGPPKWNTINSNLPCYVWEDSEKLATDKGIIEIITPMMLTLKSADIKTGDQILQVVNRSFTKLYDKMPVETVLSKQDHKKVRLKKIG